MIQLGLSPVDEQGVVPAQLLKGAVGKGGLGGTVVGVELNALPGLALVAPKHNGLIGSTQRGDAGRCGIAHVHYGVLFELHGGAGLNNQVGL